MRPEWKDRLAQWTFALEKEFYEPLGPIALEGFCTNDFLDEQEAETHAFSPMPQGTRWGRRWEYCWMRGDIRLDERAKGRRIVMSLQPGGEATLYVNGEAFGTRRAEWVKQPHHYISDQVLTLNGQPGDRYHLLMEAYAGHGFPADDRGGCATGPIRGETNDYQPTPDGELRSIVGENTYGIWHEDAYQLWLDVTVLRDLLSVLDDTALRAARIEEALEQFTLIVDFEQPREARLNDYRRAREALRPALQAVNGSTAPRFSAVGNAHLDLSWLWPFRETQRKVARTFAQQVRLMDMYPDYKFIQSQPESYRICKEMYPRLYEKVKEKIKAGQWIADGSMWVEPDTNMIGGEAMIRQLVIGKKFYKDEFGVDCQLLWLPDTFGYSGALPQILKNCGVKYLTTQKIFWNYNGGDRFPYHYFTWQGIDGTEIISFLHMDYTSRTDPATMVNRWKERAQKRDLDRFLVPFGYGDGGGGPTRDHIEFVLREKNLEGVPQVEMEAPQQFFENMAREGEPANRYVGELYFQCHRGTYTSQAAIKRGNRKSEIALREAEIWSVAAMDRLPYPADTLDQAWKQVLLNQFHDILPGSSIARVYEEAGKRYQDVAEKTDAILQGACGALAQGEGTTYFNSLSWPRHGLVKTAKGYARVTVPPMGWTSRIEEWQPETPVTARTEGDEIVLANGKMKIRINRLGEITQCLDAQGKARLSGKGNQLKLYKDTPRMYDAWDVDSMYAESPVDLGQEGSLRLIEDTPWRAAVEITRHFSGSEWKQIISLEADSARVDFDTTVLWQEQHRLLKVAFPTGIHAEEGLNEIQFGYIRRPTHRSRAYDADRFEVCNHRYTALCDENRGAAVLNDSKYGVSMLGDEIALTLLRAPTCPDLHADQGTHHFTYSYVIWDGPFMNSDVVRQAYEVNVPLRAAAGRSDSYSLLEVDQPNVIVEAVKAAEDGSGDIILRLYECKHAACDATLTLHMPVRKAYLSDMLEAPQQEVTVENGRIDLSFHGFEIKTLRIQK